MDNNSCNCPVTVYRLPLVLRFGPATLLRALCEKRCCARLGFATTTPVLTLHSYDFSFFFCLYPVTLLRLFHRRGGVHKREEGSIYLDSSWGVLDILVPLLGSNALSEVINIEERRPGRHYIINCTVQIIFQYLGDALPILQP